MNKGRVYCSSDWHGCWHVAKKVLDYLQPEDTLYYLGDATDRGESGVKIFQALVNDPRVKMIKGNHDAMMADAIPYIWEEIEDCNVYNGNKAAVCLWLQNGGSKTAKDFYYMPKEEVYAIKEAVDKMPTEMIYKSPAGHTVIMEHAGYTPFDIPHRSHDPLWDREHFYDNWNNGFEREGFNPDTTYLIHGHTPVQYLEFMYGYNGKSDEMTTEKFIAKRQFMQEIVMDGEEIIKPKIIRYCSGHKFDVDMCTIASDRIALLDLDTFEEIYFDGEE